MRLPVRRRDWPATLAILIAVLGLASCAPRLVQPPDLDATRRQQRFTTALARRVAKSAAAEGEMSVWVRSNRMRDLPGARARLVLAAPDAFRIRVDSAFGTAVDVAVRGDSVTAYVPSRRAAMVLEAAEESLGVRDPGGIGVRLWSAAWDPPGEAWESASWRDSSLRVRWTDERDTLELTIDSSGLPSALTLWPETGGAMTVLYETWSAMDGVMWPSRLRFDTVSGSLRVTARIQRVTFGRPDPARLRVRLPAGTERYTLARLRTLLRRVGEM